MGEAVKYNADAISNCRKTDDHTVEATHHDKTIIVRRKLIGWMPTIEICIDGFRVFEASADEEERHFFEVLVERCAQRTERQHNDKMMEYGPAFEAIVKID